MGHYSKQLKCKFAQAYLMFPSSESHETLYTCTSSHSKQVSHKDLWAPTIFCKLHYIKKCFKKQCVVFGTTWWWNQNRGPCVGLSFPHTLDAIIHTRSEMEVCSPLIGYHETLQNGRGSLHLYVFLTAWLPHCCLQLFFIFPFCSTLFLVKWVTGIYIQKPRYCIHRFMCLPRRHIGEVKIRW